MLFLRLTLILGLVSALATGALALTYKATEPSILKAEKDEKQAALKDVFFNGYARVEEAALKDGGSYFKIFTKEDTAQPSFFAVVGAGIGYNKSVPIELMVGFYNPAHPANAGKGGKDLVCYGWKVVKSSETPGLGENARDLKPTFTWWGKLTGQADDTSPDRRTPFQKQFEGKKPQELVAKGNIDIITGSTYSTLGVIAAVQEAGKRLQEALGAR